MRIDAGLIIGVALEFIIMLYFANSTLQPKKNYYISSAMCFVGYLIVFAFSLFNQLFVNVGVFIVINLLIFNLGYRINFKTSIFQTIMLLVFMFLGEIIVAFTMKMGLDRKKVISSEKSSLLLAVVPIMTFVCLIMVYPLNIDKRIFSSVCIIAITLNVVTFSINEFMLAKNRRIRILEDENYKNCIELEEYKTLNEKYEHSRIMNHDFREHLNVLKTLISEDIQKAQEYVGKIEKECEDSKIEKYSDNNILNILLIRKKKECEENGIKLNITSTNPKLDFIDGMDTVAIFSNLINNAIEACSDSARKDIFIDLYTVNNAFSVIKVENYADKEPIVVEGMLRSGKDDGNSHGIGIKSINNSLSKYDGKMSWSYDKAKGMFRTVISINNSQINI